MAIDARSLSLSPAGWAEALSARSDDDLAHLLTLRPDLVLGEPRSLAEVAAAMVAPPSVRDYLHRADRAERQVVETLCALAPSPGAPVATAAVARALGAEADAVRPVVDRLSRAGMVLARGEEVSANPGLERVVPFPCGLGPPAAALLGARTVPELAAIASKLCLQAQGWKKAEVLAGIAGALADRELVQALLASAPTGTRRIVDLAAFEWPALETHYGVAAMARLDDHPLGWCLGHGLLVATGYSTVVMPREAAVAVRGGSFWRSFDAQPPALSAEPLDGDAVDRGAADAALALVAAVDAICEEWSAAPATLLQAGGLGIREVRRVSKLLGRPEDETARFVELAAGACLVGVEGQTAAPTAEYDRWRELGLAARWAVLAMSWLVMPVHMSVAGAKDGDGKPFPPLVDRQVDEDAPACRALLLRLLASAGPAAVDPATLAGRALWERPAIWADCPADPDVVVAWLLEEARLVGMAAHGGLSTQGATVAGGDPAGAVRALEALLPPLVDEVILQADMTATVTGQPRPELRAELDLLADVRSSGNATVWRIGEASVVRAFEAGRTAAQILSFLEGHAPLGVPQSLAYLVEDVGRRYSQVRVGPARAYVRSDDPALLAEIVRAKKAAGLGLRVIAPTVAVSAGAPQVVVSTLKSAGYLAAGETSDGEIEVARPSPRRAAGMTAGPASVVAELLDGGIDEMVERLGQLVGLGQLGQLRRLGGVPCEADLPTLVGRLRGTGSAAPAARPPARGPGASPSRPSLHVVGDPPATTPPLFGRDAGAPAGPARAPERPSRIAKGLPDVPELLSSALRHRWPVRMGYVGASGAESEVSAEVLGIRGGRLRVRFLAGRQGGAELAMRRVRWARVLTAMEEEVLTR